MKYVFVDLDHTLFHSAWRDHMSPTANRDSTGTAETDWTAYSLAASHDDPVQEMCELVHCLSRNFTLIVLTAIHERFRGLTRQRLLEAGVLDLFDEILMRPNEYDGMPSAILKPGMIIDYLKPIGRSVRDLVAFAIDDRPDVAEAYKALGITVLQPHVVRRDDEDKIFCDRCNNRPRCRKSGSCDLHGGDL